MSLLLGIGAPPAWSAQQVIQTLDQVKVFGGNSVLRMPFNDPYRDSSDALPTGIAWPAGFVACKQTSASGLVCLTNDEWVVNWPDPSNPSGEPRLFSCNAVNQLLDDRASNTCTGLTADDAGVIWLAGKNKGKTHSLVKVTAGACTTTNADRQTFSGQGGTFCGETWDTGRPLLLDVTRVEGELAKNFGLFGDGETIVGLEQRLNAVIFSATNQNQYIEIPGGKSGWVLDRKEELQSIALLQRKAAGAYENYVLVTTSLGRVLAKDTARLDLPATTIWSENSTGCIGTPQFALRASPKGEVVYLSNKACARTVALQANPSPDALLLVPATETIYADKDGNALNEPLTTPVPVLHSSVGPEGLTVAPGEDLNLGDCDGSSEEEACKLVQGAKLWNVSFLGNPGVTLFQIKNIPDCRWIPAASAPVECGYAGVLDMESVPNNMGMPAAAQYLNVKPLLPPEVVEALEAKGILLPELLISPQFRGQDQNDSTFEAFFVAVDEGTTFTGTFDGEFDALVLAGAELGCSTTTGVTWDIVTKVSERYLSVDDRYVDLLLNTGCGSSAIKSMGFSLFSYNLEVTPDTYLPGRTVGGILDEVVENNDAVFARLVGKLFADLQSVASHYACASNVDASGSRPISTLKCTTLLSDLANAGDKLGKCIEATYQPKQSASNQNCQSFLQQIATFRATLAAPDTGVVGSDPANRVGELSVRDAVMMHVYDTRFVPSVPNGGFCKEAGTC